MLGTGRKHRFETRQLFILTCTVFSILLCRSSRIKLLSVRSADAASCSQHRTSNSTAPRWSDTPTSKPTGSQRRILQPVVAGTMPNSHLCRCCVEILMSSRETLLRNARRYVSLILAIINSLCGTNHVLSESQRRLHQYRGLCRCDHQRSRAPSLLFSPRTEELHHEHRQGFSASGRETEPTVEAIADQCLLRGGPWC